MRIKNTIEVKRKTKKKVEVKISVKVTIFTVLQSFEVPERRDDNNRRVIG